MTSYHATFIAPAATIDAYRTLAATWSGGIGMFQVPVYTGSEITHYISSGTIDADIAALLDDPASFVAEINAMTGDTLTEQEAQALRDAMTIVSLPESGGTETAQQVLDRLGLSLQSTEVET